ncbi:hypothetical protein ACFV5G_22885 [Streptomyces sp. NPDC059766]|uniref:hypothetical protein n=1 Tax=Streptomyces sp. NPDC059766 TaxID=3346940 RepID=UPI00364BB6EF
MAEHQPEQADGARRRVPPQEADRSAGKLAGNTPEAEALGEWLKSKVTKGRSTRDLEELFLKKKMKGHGRNQWSLYLKGEKLISSWALEVLIDSLYPTEDVRRILKGEGRKLLRAAEQASLTRDAARTPRPGAEATPLELQLRLDEARKGQIAAQKSVWDLTALLWLTTGVIAELQQRYDALKRERPQTRRQSHTDVPNEATARLADFQHELTTARQQIAALEERAARAERERDKAEELRIAAERKVQELRRAFVQSHQEQEDTQTTVNAGTEEDSRPTQEGLQPWEVEAFLERLDDEIDVQSARLDDVRAAIELGSRPTDTQVIPGEVVRLASADGTATKQTPSTSSNAPSTDGIAVLTDSRDSTDSDTLAAKSPIQPKPSDAATGEPGPVQPAAVKSRRQRIVLISLGLAVVLAAAGGGTWWKVHQDDDAKAKAAAAADAKAKADARAVAWRKSHCDTGNPRLHQTSDWCAGVTDGSDRHDVFGTPLEPALKAMGAENKEAMKSPGYVTVALMAPLTEGANSLTVGRAVHQVEGALVAQQEANEGGTYPKIRLVLANMGSDESSWPVVVDELKKMTGGADRLVAVTGMGLSQQESVNAARALSKAEIPMVGDLITADGFDKTGSIDHGAEIPGLVRIAPNSSAQMKAISQEIHKHPKLKTAALVSAPTTPNGTPDFYTDSLKGAFQNPAIGLLPYVQAGHIDFPFDAREGAVRPSLETLSNNLCGKTVPDLVFWAGRATHLPDFLEYLRQRECHTTPITVVTGSDAATLDPKLAALHDPDAPISLLYVPLADPGQLDAETNPDRGLFKKFVEDFDSNHHGQRFDKKHLASGWAVMAHDGFLVASQAIRKAIDTPQTPPTLHAVTAQLYLFDTTNVIRGASGIFRINPNTGNRKTSRNPQVKHQGNPLQD